MPAFTTSLSPFLSSSPSFLQPSVYYRHPFLSAASQKQLVPYIVLDIEPVPQQGAGSGGYGYGQQQQQQQGRFLLAEAQVARASDFGRNDKIVFTRTHLGHLLKPGEDRRKRRGRGRVGEGGLGDEGRDRGVGTWREKERRRGAVRGGKVVGQVGLGQLLPATWFVLMVVLLLQ